jgi:hypothetical protein
MSLSHIIWFYHITYQNWTKRCNLIRSFAKSSNGSFFPIPQFRGFGSQTVCWSAHCVLVDLGSTDSISLSLSFSLSLSPRIFNQSLSLRHNSVVPSALSEQSGKPLPQHVPDSNSHRFWCPFALFWSREHRRWSGLTLTEFRGSYSPRTQNERTLHLTGPLFRCRSFPYPPQCPKSEVNCPPIDCPSLFAGRVERPQFPSSCPNAVMRSLPEVALHPVRNRLNPPHQGTLDRNTDLMRNVIFLWNSFECACHFRISIFNTVPIRF